MRKSTQSFMNKCAICEPRVMIILKVVPTCFCWVVLEVSDDEVSIRSDATDDSFEAICDVCDGKG